MASAAKQGVVEYAGVVVFIAMVLLCNLSSCACELPVQILVDDDLVVLDNGIVKIALSNPEGTVADIRYSEEVKNNLVMPSVSRRRRGYWDLDWKKPGFPLMSDLINGEEMRVVSNTSEQVEVSFTRKWTPKYENTSRIPLNFDIRYILTRGKSGFYAYGVYKKPKLFPTSELVQTRIVFRLNSDIFTRIRISDTKTRVMPTLTDLRRGKQIAFKAATQLYSYTNSDVAGEVDDKYMYAENVENATVYGWMGETPKIGFWTVYPSIEFVNSGPTKQDVTVHTGPVCLIIFQSGHFMSFSSIVLNQNQSWRKVFGPAFVYLNSVKNSSDVAPLWYLSRVQFPAQFAYVGLSASNDESSWQFEGKGYQFWTKTDDKGYFNITNVTPGRYFLYAWNKGLMGEYRHQSVIEIQGFPIHLQDIIFFLPRTGPTLWDIGIPDRTAAEFYIPNPEPNYVNTLFVDIGRYRQYGIWDRYTDIFPASDLVYTTGVSDYRKDWLYAHVSRKTTMGTNVPATWRIDFWLNNVNTNGVYTLWIAIAASNYARFEVRFNNPDVSPAHFAETLIGNDNAIARHGIHGVYQPLNIRVDPRLLIPGTNRIYLTQRNAVLFAGHMYNYLRMDGPQ